MQNIVDSKEFYGLKKSFKLITSLLESQQKNGILNRYKLFNEDVLTKEEYPEGLINPPILGLVLKKLFEKKPFHIKWKHILDSLSRYHDAFIEYRDPAGTGLLSILHPKEGIQTSTTVFDHVKQQHDISINQLYDLFEKYGYDQEIMYHTSTFNIKSVGVNVLFALSLEAEYYLNKKLHDLTGDEELLHKASIAKRRQIRTQTSIYENLWNKEHNCFFSYNTKTQRHIPIKTSDSLLPVSLGIKNAKTQKTIQLLCGEEFQPRRGYGVTTTGLNTRKFKAQTINKGPANPFVNWLLIRGLREVDAEIAHNLKTQTLNMIREEYKEEDCITPAKSLLRKNNFVYPTKNLQFSNIKQDEYVDNMDMLASILGWIHIKDKPRTDMWQTIDELRKKDLTNQEIKHQVKTPLFFETYTVRDSAHKNMGEGLGHIGCTMTSAVFLHLKNR